MSADIIATIYVAAFIPELWPSVLQRMAGLSDSMGAAMFLFADGRPTRGIALDSQKEQLEQFLESDTLPFSNSVQRVCANQPASFVELESMLSPDELDNDRVTQHYRSLGIGSHLGTAIAMPSGELAIFVHQRWQANGPYKSEEIDNLDRLRPHLSRASLISVQLGLERARGAVTSMERMGLPAVVLTATGRVKATNQLFNDLEAAFISTAFGGLAARDPAVNRLLQQALQASGSRYEPLVRSIPIPQRDGHPPLIAHVLPLWRAAHEALFGGDILLAVTTFSVSSLVPTSNILTGLFDLTPAEAKLAIALTRGASLKQAAAASGIKVSTARSYLEQVFQKTGTHQQSELVALLKSPQPDEQSPRR